MHSDKDEEERLFEKVKDPNSYIERLKGLKKSFEFKQTFEAGDIVTWKDGLKNKKYPEYGSPGIIMKILDPIVIDSDRDPSSPYYNEPLDILVGFMSKDKEFVVFGLDSRRFTHFNPI